jgi:hypothetical protein
MTRIRPEVTGRKPRGETATHVGLGHNRGPPLDPDWIELQRIVSLREASRLSGLSIDTIKRRHRDKIINLSLRRRGIRICDALMMKTATARSPRFFDSSPCPRGEN